MASPDRTPRDLSPDSHASGSRPAKKPRTTVADLQRRQLDKLLANPEKEVALPTGVVKKELRAPRDMMKNVQGSSAGAGSGEFHVYKQSRRREYERLRMMEEESKAEEERAAFAKRQAERDAEAESKTAKNRAKRQKRKQGRNGSKPAAIENTPTGGGGLTRKLEASGPKIAFRRPGEDDDGEEEEEAEPAPPHVEEKVEEPEKQRAVEETKITIVDED
ncbi:hypothetical protein I350_04202 [Cryptococcus amylolentus CBS 6273]|uniref:PRKR-interacting protein 1 n=1 Tax=Cryptococcus amylolentus CBS 6273 TaxID=1296118 RepID=A0A1E3K3Q9_9TREE|nr:hypothetical protein I350_04202 [Cryptococcus amylolentus CBS 6273]